MRSLFLAVRMSKIANSHKNHIMGHLEGISMIYLTTMNSNNEDIYYIYPLFQKT